MRSKSIKPYDFREDVRRMLTLIPETCPHVRLYPAGLNYCEIYLLAGAIEARFASDANFRVLSEGESKAVFREQIDVDYLYDLNLNEYGMEVQLCDSDNSVFFILQRDSAFAILAGDADFVSRAIPYPDDIWSAYFEEVMRANEPEAYEWVLELFEKS